MTRREWLVSWKKSSNGGSVAKEFERDMIFRTIIKKATKSLVNSNSNNFVPTMEEDDDMPLAGNSAPEVDDQSYTSTTTDFVEVEEAEEAKVVEPVKVEEVVEEPSIHAKAPKEDIAANDSDFDF